VKKKPKAKAKAKPKAIPPSQWEWFGNAGHFICGRWCRFHLCTLVGEYLVSTVGEYVHPSHSNGSEAEEERWLIKNYPSADIGFGRKYETMVFTAGERCLSSECNCGLPTISGGALDFLGYNTAGDATKGHLMFCQTWARKQT
jgi:hypothetical protein